MYARLDYQRRGGVPQVVNAETITETGAAAGRCEDRALPVGQPRTQGSRLAPVNTSGGVA